MALDDRQRRAVELMATGNYGIQAIADDVGVSRQTIWAWKKTDEFKAELDASLTALREDAITKLKAKCGFVMDELLDMALDKNTDARTKAQVLQYLSNRLYGTPTSAINLEVEDKTNIEQSNALAEFKAFVAEQTNETEQETNK